MEGNDDNFPGTGDGRHVDDDYRRCGRLVRPVGDLAKPLTIVGMCLFLVGGFLKYQWGTYW